MKKITSLVAGLMLLFTGVNYAQNTTTAPAPKAKTDQKAPAAKGTSTTTHMKKDGTPDKRYSENKGSTAKPATTHTKKDGTPDMRYKENKTSTPAKK